MNEQVQDIPLSQIVPGDNDRKEFPAHEIQELADSIREHGLVQPITVRPKGLVYREIATGEEALPAYEIVAGERRWRAHQLLGAPTIKAIVRDLSDAAASDIMLIENVNRVDLNPMDEARAYDKRAKSLDGSEKEKNEIIAAKVGKSPQYIADRRALLKLVDEVQFHVKSGALPLGHAVLMVKLDTNRQRMALTYYNRGGKMAQGLFAELCRQLYAAQVEEEQKGMSLFDTSLWDSLSANAEAILKLRGKKAVVAVPKRDDLPPVTNIRRDETLAEVTERYIAELVAAGKQAEAEALGHFYSGAVGLNFLKLPVGGTYTSQAIGGKK